MEKLDAVYLAPDPGSLFGAVALAAGGLKVLVLDGETRKARDKRLSDASWPKNAPAEPFLLRGLRSGGFLEPLLNRLGLLNKARDMATRLDPSFQTITPDVRVDVWSGKDEILREFTREFGPQAKNATAMFAGFEAIAEEVYKLTGSETFPNVQKGSKLFRRGPSSDPAVDALRAKPLVEVLDEQSLGPVFRNFLFGTMVGLGAPATDKISLAAAASVVDSARRGVYRVGTAELISLVVGAFKSKGGFTFPLAELEAAETNGKEITALRMPKNNFVRAKMFIGGAGLLADYLPDEMAKAILPQGSPTSHKLEIIMDSDAVPVGMQNRATMLAKRADIVYHENVARISVGPEFEDDGRKVRIVSAETQRPGTDSVKDELNAMIASIVPFVDDFRRKERYTLETSSVALDSKSQFLDMPQTGPIENLLPNESDLLAGMGLGLDVVSGRILARIVLKKLGLRAEI